LECAARKRIFECGAGRNSQQMSETAQIKPTATTAHIGGTGSPQGGFNP
jgi:hypothetical protein